MSSLLGRTWVRQTLSLATLLLLWEGFGRAGLIDPFYAPPPTTIEGVATRPT